jgi:hypothetical protein
LQFKEQVLFKLKNKNISGSMQKEDLSADTTFDPCSFSLDFTFKSGDPLGPFLRCFHWLHEDEKSARKAASQ